MIDISVSLHPAMPTWPGSTGVQLLPTMQLAAGDPANVSRLDCDVHSGTHIDAPRHFLAEGKTVEHLALDVLIGPATVTYLPEVTAITATNLAELNIPAGTRRLLLRTRNSELWATGVNEFQPDFVALTADAAQWLVDRGIQLIGIDYLSIQRFADGPLTHQILLEAEVIILEGLNLASVAPGEYELLCLPLALIGIEAAPARAVLRPLSTR